MADLPILWRSDESTAAEYEEARTRMFNVKRPENYPRAIVRATTLEHIVAAVKLAAEQGTRVVARSGGHGLSCWTLRHDAILIDLQNFKHLSYDDETQEAQASPSTLAEELMNFLAEKGRAFPQGHVGDIGLGGYLLQAGIGYHARSYGYGCEWVNGLDVVTAQGQVVHCDENENPDLYWAARGAGPEFPAIVTRFYLRTMEKQPVQRGCHYIWPTMAFEPVFSWFDQLTGSLHPDADPSLFVLNMPQIGQPGIMVSVTALGQTEDEVRQKLAPVVDTRPSGTISASDWLETTFSDAFAGSKLVNPPGHRYYTDSIFLKPGTDIVAVGREFFTNIPFPRAMAYWQPLRFDRERPRPDMAMSVHAEHYISLLAIWEDPAEDEAQTEWVNEGVKKMEPWIHGTFVADAHPERRRSKYWSDEALGMLVEVQNRWDPRRTICGILLEGI